MNTTKKEVTLKLPIVSELNKGLSAIFVLAGVVMALVAVFFFITIIGFFAAIGAIVVSAFCFVISQRLKNSSVGFSCPYCKKQLMVMGGIESIKCVRCGDLILLKWETPKSIKS
ncbi:MAG: hypothetical protein PHO02_00930 [Candidatus Nanoarchaeia archaeon]|nr:hypothetical protein [Candidatus Nanoarchaeia archaeon]